MKYYVIIFLFFLSSACFSQKKDSVNFKTDSTVILHVLSDIDAFFRKSMSYDVYTQGNFAAWLNAYYADKQKEFIKPKSK